MRKEKVRAAMKIKTSGNAIDPGDASVVVWRWREGSGLWTILFNTVLKSEGKSGRVALCLCRQKEAYKG